MIVSSGVTNVKDHCLKTRNLSVIIKRVQAYTHSQNCNIGDIE